MSDMTSVSITGVEQVTLLEDIRRMHEALKSQQSQLEAQHKRHWNFEKGRQEKSRRKRTSKGTEYAEKIRSLLREDRPHLREHAAAKLSQTTAQKRGSDKNRGWIFGWLLALIPEPMFVDTFVTMNDDALSTLRRFATPEQTPWTADKALAALEPFGDLIVPGLIEALQTEDIMLQLLALQIIQQIGSNATDAVPMIIAKLESDDRCVQLAAASALGAIGASARDALPVLNDMLESDDEYARLVGADSIVRIDSASERAISIIFNVLNNKNSPHKLFAAASLGECGNEDAVPHLKQLLNDEDAGVLSEASLAIWKITGDSADALTVGRKLIDDPDWLVRQIGIEHFEQLGVVP